MRNSLFKQPRRAHRPLQTKGGGAAEALGHPSAAANGIPLFLDQLTRTLEAEQADHPAESLRISGPAGGDSLALSEMG
ncbi:MAG: hypothetical protein ABI330_08490 [Caldimonas sp.]